MEAPQIHRNEEGAITSPSKKSETERQPYNFSYKSLPLGKSKVYESPVTKVNAIFPYESN